MGTRGLVKIYEEDGDEIVTIYKQYDCGPEGLGEELKEFLKDMTIVNGFGLNTPKIAANGMSCLAAQLVAHMKEGIGNVYLHPAGTTDCGEDFVYNIKQKGTRIELLCLDDYSGEITVLLTGD